MSYCNDVRPYIFGSLLEPADLALSPAGSGSPQASSEPPAQAAPPDGAAVTAAAWEEGYQQGYAEGLRAARAAQQAAVERLAALASQALADAQQYTVGLEAQVVDLSLAVARKVVEREAQVDRTLVERVVRAALAEIQDTVVVAVLVHPEDHAALAPHWETVARQALAGAVAGRVAPPLVADERIQPGGCVIQTQVGQVDAQLVTKLAEVAGAFRLLCEGGAV